MFSCMFNEQHIVLLSPPALHGLLASSRAAWPHQVGETFLNTVGNCDPISCTSREAINQVGLVHDIKEGSSEAVTRGYFPSPFSSNQLEVLSLYEKEV